MSAEVDTVATKHVVREGDKSWAPHPELRRLVRITYRVVPEFSTEQGWLVRDALLGVCDETGDVLTVPHQSAPAFSAARLAYEAEAQRARVRA
jgi:hypothetical protein